MLLQDINHDAIIIGGGFYGTAIAIYLARKRGIKRVLLVEKEAGLLRRASYNNQARVHNGYHYPRSFTTAYRSRVNFPKFVEEWHDAVRSDFTKLYAIARHNSKVTAKQFERFCKVIGAKISPAESAYRSLFEPRLIEDVFLVEEHAFDSIKLADWAYCELNKLGVQIQFSTTITKILNGPNGSLKVFAKRKNDSSEIISCHYVFNCTYCGINHLNGDFLGVKSNLKHEITELALMRMPTPLKDLGITVMDGPFFSMMPFPARGLHTLSHVRYTPHLHWIDQRDINPYEKIQVYDCKSRVERMVRDVARYLPLAKEAIHIDSLYEVKTVLVKNETDDGRPILFEKHTELKGCYSILGGKIDNIYDVFEKLDTESFIKS